MTFNSNLSLGSLSSIMAIISIFVTILFMKKYSQKRSKIVFLCLALCAVGVLAPVLSINKATIVLFNVLYTITMIVPDNLYNKWITAPNWAALSDHIFKES
jgi:predicted membrane channel-forming protein YqfA (hemolysin III family)